MYDLQRIFGKSLLFLCGQCRDTGRQWKATASRCHWNQTKHICCRPGWTHSYTLQIQVPWPRRYSPCNHLHVSYFLLRISKETVMNLLTRVNSARLCFCTEDSRSEQQKKRVPSCGTEDLCIPFAPSTQTWKTQKSTHERTKQLARTQWIPSTSNSEVTRFFVLSTNKLSVLCILSKTSKLIEATPPPKATVIQTCRWKNNSKSPCQLIFWYLERSHAVHVFKHRKHCLFSLKQNTGCLQPWGDINLLIFHIQPSAVWWTARFCYTIVNYRAQLQSHIIWGEHITWRLGEHYFAETKWNLQQVMNYEASPEESHRTAHFWEWNQMCWMKH